MEFRRYFSSVGLSPPWKVFLTRRHRLVGLPPTLMSLMQPVVPSVVSHLLEPPDLLSFLRVGLLWRLRRSFTEMGFFRCLSFSRSRGGASPEIPQLVSSSWDPPLIPKELSPFMGNATPSIFLFWLFKNSNALDSSRVW
ncbi:unnamed protein product [Arabidopsis thaliana]|uniref:Uncharacterized protein n=1 Tax=Arabidopsis thaliana TaxID=3702 RepID=A0A5S9WYJ2_ARATH|nr:unnamed protein product [Arabidopsis thaliana]